MRRLGQVLLVVAAATLPFWPGVPAYWITLGCYSGMAALVALGIVLLTGIAGILSFGQAIFAGCAAYTTAVLTTHYGWSPWLTLPVSVAGSGLLAWGIGLATLPLKGHYLPVATLAWNVSLFYLAGSLDLLGRYEGISGIPALTLGPVSLAEPGRYYLLVLAAVVGACLAVRNLLASRTGRALRALRGGRLAAECFGVNTDRARLLAFVLAAVLAGLSGWLYAHFQRAINPSPFSLTASIDYLLMAVLGGVGHIGGALLGALLVTIGRDKLTDILPASAGAQAAVEPIVFGGLFLALLLFAPNGLWSLWGDKKRGARLLAKSLGMSKDDGRVGPSNRGAPEGGRDVLTVSGLRKSFGGLVAVDDLSFSVRAGEIVGLIGPNGAGKSTTFNLVTGVTKPSAGTVSMAGVPVTGWRPRGIAKLGLARTFQHVKFAPEMSALENVALGRHIRGRAGPIRAMLRLDRAEEAGILLNASRQLKRVDLVSTDIMSAAAGDLPLGTQRLVEIARALASDPVLLLLDEPAAGLRHGEKQKLATLLRRLRDEGVSVLLVEHDMDFVMGLVDRLVVMNFGSKLAEGSPAEIQAHPAVREAYLGADT